MYLSEHISFAEMVHTDRTEFQDQNAKLAMQFLDNMKAVCAELEKIRQFLCRPVIINSGFRCPELNFRVGGSPTSQHTQGGAADITIKDFEDLHGLQFAFDWLANHTNYGQLILENPAGRNPWVHYGIPRIGRERKRFVFDGKEYKPV